MAPQRVLQWPLRFPVDCNLVHTVQDPIEVALECLLGFTMFFPKDSWWESKGFPSWGPNGLVKDFPKGKGLLKDCLKDSRRFPKDSPRDSKGLPRNSPNKF